MKKDDLILDILSKHKNGSFLEIGIGAQPNKSRISLINEMNINYVGLDFQDVCDHHAERIKSFGGYGENIKFMGNSRSGSYLFNLIHLLNDGKTFDYIYFDGHHTLNVDAPPAIIALKLLSKEGLISFDDYLWTLASQEENIKKSSFYQSMYDLDAYTEYERSTPHIKLMVENILNHVADLKPLEKYSTDMWKTFSV